MQRINGTLRFARNDGVEVPLFPNPISNSTITYSHWNFYHYAYNRCGASQRRSAVHRGWHSNCTDAC